jgi:hypothetical protein
MALKQSYTVQAEIPEALAEHYVEKDGRWILVTDPPTDDVTGIKTALDKERGLRRDAERHLNDLKIKFDGIDPEEVAKLKDRVKSLDDQELYDRNGIEVLVSKRTQSMKDDYTRVLQAKDNEIGQLRDANATLDKKWRQDRIKTALLDAATRAGVAKHALPDAVQRGMAVFVDLDDQGNVIAKQGDDIRYGKDGVSPFSPDEWLQGIKADAPHLWPQSVGTGLAHSRNGNGTEMDYSAIKSPTERLTAFRQAQKTRG